MQPEKPETHESLDAGAKREICIDYNAIVAKLIAEGWPWRPQTVDDEELGGEG